MFLLLFCPVGLEYRNVGKPFPWVLYFDFKQTDKQTEPADVAMSPTIKP